MLEKRVQEKEYRSSRKRENGQFVSPSKKISMTTMLLLILGGHCLKGTICLIYRAITEPNYYNQKRKPSKY